LRPRAVIFDFDGVLLESELEFNRIAAGLLTELGHPVTVDEALLHFVGLSGKDVVQAIERRIGAPLPPDYQPRMKASGQRVLREGIAAVAGAIEFVRSLPPDMPRAVASSSSTRWMRGHLAHLGIGDAFADHLYSGAEHVERGKPAPDLYLHAAEQLGVGIAHCAIIEDSRVGATGALASGGRVIGLAAGSHCLDGHAGMLRDVGVEQIAHSFADVARMLELDQPGR
jgi:HAD superfamily hydrolase (TIGR01509 family)